MLTQVREIKMNAVDPRGGILMLQATMVPPTFFAADVSSHIKLEINLIKHLKDKKQSSCIKLINCAPKCHPCPQRAQLSQQPTNNTHMNNQMQPCNAQPR
ncbi:TPA: hypothetical protein ACH3X3_009628 [Trebouxia sp. C0006]